MVDRNARLALTALATALAACGSPPERAVGPGAAAPVLLAASAPDRVRATWVFSGDDLMRCRSSARELRHLQARFGGSIETLAVAVDADTSDVTGFMRSQRVRGPIAYLRRSHDAARLRGVELPALYLVRGSRVEAVFPGVPLDDTRSLQARDVEAKVVSLLGRSGTTSFDATVRPGEIR